MGNRKYPLLPVEVIEEAVIGEPEAIEKVLRHYTGYITYLSTHQGYVSRDIQDRLEAKLIKAVLRFQLDR